jgi:hypothetical protein
MTMRAYAGIGSRETPPDVQKIMTRVAYSLEEFLILRSGAAQGADAAFELGISDPTRKEIYLPWNGFNNRRAAPGVYLPEAHMAAQAQDIAARYHPAWNRLSQGARTLMSRNAFQILGRNLLDPCLFVLCWTPHGSGSGGTGQAIRMARHLDIPVFDLGKVKLDDVVAEIELLIREGTEHG